MNIDSKKNNIESMIKSLKLLKITFQEVNKIWSNCDFMDELLEFQYPFIDSFDELNLKIQNWTDSSIKELQKIHDKKYR